MGLELELEYASLGTELRRDAPCGLRRRPGPQRDPEADELQDPLGRLPRRKRGKLVRPEDEGGIGQPALLEGIDRSRVPVQLDARPLDVLEGETGELEPRLGRGRGSLVTRIRDDEDEKLPEGELAQSRPRESDVSEVRRVEDATKDSRRRYCHSSSSSPTST